MVTMLLEAPAITFADWLVELMDRRGIGNNQLAAFLDVGKNTVSLWRQGKSIPDPPNCYKIAEYFKRQPEEVLARAGHLHRSPDEITILARLAELQEARDQIASATARLDEIERDIAAQRNRQSTE